MKVLRQKRGMRGKGQGKTKKRNREGEKGREGWTHGDENGITKKQTEGRNETERVEEKRKRGEEKKRTCKERAGLRYNKRNRSVNKQKRESTTTTTTTRARGRGGETEQKKMR